MTYRALKNHLAELPECQLNDDVTVHVGSQNEFFPVTGINVTGETADVLDPNHIYLEIQG